MATFEESFLYLLILLLIGAGVSGVLVAWLTNLWQNHRKKLEIKANIASKIDEVVGSVEAKIFFSSRRQEPISNIDEVLEKYYVDAYIVDSMLESYYSSKTGIIKEWTTFFTDYLAFIEATSLYFVKDPTEHEKSLLERDLNDIKRAFPDNKEINALTTDMPFDDELWRKIGNLHVTRAAKVVLDVLKLPIKVF
jgi:type I restriction-modification system DNA methylase subunit